MKKNEYQRPTVIVMEIQPQQIICVSKGASNYVIPPTEAEIGIEWGTDGLLDIEDV